MIAEEKVSSVKRTRILQSAWFRVLIGSAVLVALLFVLRLDGKPHGDWLQFLGRFHPALLHLPIGLILLLPVLEIGARRRPALTGKPSAHGVTASAVSPLIPLPAPASADAGAGVFWGAGIVKFVIDRSSVVQ